MGDPTLYRGEQVIMRTSGVYVKSIPFEGILTNMRIILVDRAKNILPTKEIAYEMVQEIEIGENAISDQILTLTVLTTTGETRQMILTFSQREGGNRLRERDDWARIIQQYASASQGTAARPVAGATQKVSVKRVVESESTGRQAPPPAPAPGEPEISSSAGTVFCSRCGNRVLANSAFCNKCGSPIVAPAQASRQAAPAPQRQQAPPPVQEPAYGQPAVRVPVEPPRAAQPPAPRQAVPVQKPPVKKGFLSGLFSGGRKKQAAPRPATPSPEMRPRRSLMPGKKVIIAGVVIVVIIAVLAIGVLFVYPMLSSSLSSGGDSSSSGSSGGSLFGGSSSSTSTLTNTGVDSITVKETTAPTVPVTGVWIMIDYVGSYKGSYGMSSDLQSLESSGSRLFEVVNATGIVKADVEKKDSSTKHELSVSIYKDGKLMKNGKTSDSYGKVTISADVGGSAVSATTTTTGTNGNTTTTVSTTNTTTNTTAVKTTVTTKTTTKST